MSSGLTFTRLLRRSLVDRGRRSLSALLALTVSAAVATALLTLYADLDSKLHREFRGFGANITLRSAAPSASPDGNPDSAASGPNQSATSHTVASQPATLAPLPADALPRAQAAAGPESIVAPFSFSLATTDRGVPVVVVGADFALSRRLNAWWRVDAWPQGRNDALLGEKAANFVADQRNLTLTSAGRRAVFHGAGRLHTGGAEDSRIYVPLSAYTQWTGLAPNLLEIQVPGGVDAVNAAVARLRTAFPAATVEPVRQLVAGESRIIDRTHALMLGAVLLIALTVAVSVLATLSASVLERRRDFALMKALGGSARHLTALFLLEALALALAGVAIGFLLGSAAAWVIGEANFQTSTRPHPSTLLPVLLLNLLIAAISALLPVQSLRTLEPAALLRGE